MWRTRFSSPNPALRSVVEIRPAEPLITGDRAPNFRRESDPRGPGHSGRRPLGFRIRMPRALRRGPSFRRSELPLTKNDYAIPFGNPSIHARQGCSRPAGSLAPPNLCPLYARPGQNHFGDDRRAGWSSQTTPADLAPPRPSAPQSPIFVRSVSPAWCRGQPLSSRPRWTRSAGPVLHHRPPRRCLSVTVCGRRTGAFRSVPDGLLTCGLPSAPRLAAANAAASSPALIPTRRSLRFADRSPQRGVLRPLWANPAAPNAPPAFIKPPGDKKPPSRPRSKAPFVWGPFRRSAGHDRFVTRSRTTRPAPRPLHPFRTSTDGPLDPGRAAEGRRPSVTSPSCRGRAKEIAALPAPPRPDTNPPSRSRRSRQDRPPAPGPKTDLVPP